MNNVYVQLKKCPSQSQKVKYYTVILHLCEVSTVNSQRQNVEWWLPGAEGGEDAELLLNGYRVLVFQEEKRYGD